MAFRSCLQGGRVTLVLGGLPQHSHISSFLHDVFSRQVAVTLRLVICVSRAFSSTEQEKRETARSVVDHSWL